MKKYAQILFVGLLLISCKEDPVEPMTDPPLLPPVNCYHEFEGVYAGERNSTMTVLGVPESDSTYLDTVTVTRSGDFIQIQSFEYHEDSICDEQIYTILNTPDWNGVQFEGDSLHFDFRSGSNFTWAVHYFDGKKL